MKPMSFFFFAVAGIAMIFPSGAQTEKPNRIEVQGHRGARTVRPENTLAAFDFALSVGVDTLELDLGVTKDNVVVISHDPHINPQICRHADGREIKKSLAIRKLTLKEVQSFDCGSKKNPRFLGQKLVPGEKIPTLDEFFNFVKRSKHAVAKTVEFNIETKITPGKPDLAPSPEVFANLVYRKLVEHQVLSRTTVQSFDHRTLRVLRAKNPPARVSALIGGSLPNLSVLAKDLGAEVISPHLRWITKEEVDRLHAIKVRVIPWTANSEAEWDHLIKIGVDGIISDDPASLISYLEARGLR